MGTYSLPDEKDLVVTIRATDLVEVSSPSGKSEECLVVYFEETEKPMILNRTNARTIEKLAASPYVEDWPGTRIQLYVARDIKAFNTVTDALRVRDFHPKPISLDTAPVIEAINACTSIEELLKLYFSLPKEFRADDEVIHAKNLRKESLQAIGTASKAGEEEQSVSQSTQPKPYALPEQQEPISDLKHPIAKAVKPYPKPSKKPSSKKPKNMNP